MLKKDELTNPHSCLNRATDDELVFVLLERDVAAPMTIRDWCLRRVAAGKNTMDDPQITEALEIAANMELRLARTERTSNAM